MIGHRLMGSSLLCTGWASAQCRAHLDRAIALYDPVQHLPLATRLGQDTRVAILWYRSWALWALGYPDAALADMEHALMDAREIGHAGTLMFVLAWTCPIQYYCGKSAALNARKPKSLSILAGEKGAILLEGCRNVCARSVSSPGRAEPRRQCRSSIPELLRGDRSGANLFRPTQLVLVGRSPCGTRTI